MRNDLSKIDIFDLLICWSILKFFYDKLVSWFDRSNISTNKEKSWEKKFIKEKSVKIRNIIKIMRIDNAFSTNILMFCDSENKSKNSILLFFVKLKILEVD